MDGPEKATRNQPSAASFDVGFSPAGTALIVVEKAIDAAKSEILVACFEFTSREIAEALEATAYDGVKVRIVADWKASQDRFSQIAPLSRSLRFSTKFLPVSLLSAFQEPS